MGKRKGRRAGGKGCEVVSVRATAVSDGRVIWGGISWAPTTSDGGDRGKIEMNQLI